MNFTKRMTLLINILPFTISAIAEPRGGILDTDIPDIGLPNGDEVGIGLLIAVIALPIGYLFINKCGNKESSGNISFGGCLGLVLVGGGILCLIPLIAWICSIAALLVWIGIIIALIVVILAFIFGNKN